MSRRRESNGEALVDLVSRLPWWACLLVGVVGYFVLHAVATEPVKFSGLPTSGQFFGIYLRGIATAGQYIVPGVCLIAAMVSALRKQRAKSLLSGARERAPLAAIDGMTWREFEALVGEVFREMGYRVVETGGAGADGGVDLVLTKGGEKFLVQCKQWRALKVGVTVVRELYGVMSARGAVGGFVVTSGTYSEDAKAFADGRNIHLVDGQRLESWIKKARSARKPVSARPSPAPARTADTPACPSCGAAMVKREARRGSKAGQWFWGCTTYPKCRGTRPLG